MDLLLLWVLSSDCAAYVVQIEVQWIVLERFFVDNSAENTLDPGCRLECAVLTFYSLQESPCKVSVMDWSIPNRTSDGQLTITDAAGLRNLGHSSAISHVLILVRHGFLFLNFFYWLLSRWLSFAIVTSLALSILCFLFRLRHSLLLTIRDCLTERLQVKRLAESALMDVRVLGDTLMTLLWRSLDSHEETNIEVDSQTD